MVIYYAHCKAIYDTPQEQQDVELLERLGLQVVNPNDDKHKPNWAEKGMEYAHFIVGSCEALAFRALPDGSIPAGVGYEIDIARKLNFPIIEIPSTAQRRILNIEETRDYIREVKKYGY